MKYQILTLLTAAFAALPLFADTTWTGNAGDGKWSTPGNWSNGVPQGTQGEKTTFPAGDATVNVDADCYYYAIKVSGSSGTLTLTGNHKIRLGPETSSSARGVTINSGRTLVVDGPTIGIWSYDQYGDLVMKSGAINTSSKGMDFAVSATMGV